MSNEARPISPTHFASALEDLPVSNLYAKTFELRNSIAHLQRSNRELQAFADSRPEGDEDCLQAMRENEVVMGRMRDRIQLVKSEVERRGQRWHESDEEQSPRRPQENGHVDEGVELTDGATEGEIHVASTPTGGRLSDDELTRRLRERLQEQDHADGVHL